MKDPFAHTNLSAKHNFLTLARKYHKKSIEEDDIESKAIYALGSSLLYMNHADYLAQWFAHSLQTLADGAVQDYFNRQISPTKKKKQDITIYKSIKIIEQYNFADKESLIEMLENIKKARDKIAHTILKIDPKKISEIDEATAQLANLTEDLINYTDQFKRAMPPRSLQNIIDEMRSEKSN